MRGLCDDGIMGMLKSIYVTSFLALAMMGPAHAQDEASVEPDLPLSEGPSMGWTLPVGVSNDGDEETELDRLSRSASGVGFVQSLYDSKADNPLVPVSVTLRALDKITATYQDLDITIGDEVEFGTLTILPRTCDKHPPEEVPETTVFLEVFPTQKDVQGARTRAAQGDSELPNTSSIRLPGEDPAPAVRPALFRGWMFASTPSLNALEHPVYDVWVIDCKMVDPGT